MSEQIQTKYLIIGAGPCGLGAAWHFNKQNEKNWLIFEKENHAGGLATSFVDKEGFTWDIGGHVQFSHYKYFDDVMDEALGEDGWLHHMRSSWVWIKNRFVPYPFQNNIHRLPEVERNECLNGLENLPKNAVLNNFKDWLSASFGEGICKHFLYPYNFKVWAYDPALMNYKWIGERVSVVDIERIKENIKLDRDDVSWGPNNTFKFPKNGGTGAIWDSVAEKLDQKKIHFKEELISLDVEHKVAHFKSGKSVRFEKLISTIPVDQLCKKITDDNFQDLKSISSGLKYSSTHVIGLGLEGQAPESLADKCWMYFPENDSPFYRVTVFSNYSPNNVPDSSKYFSLMAEVSESTDKPVDSKKVIQETIEGSISSNLMTKDTQIVSAWHLRMEYGYPTPSLERDEILNQVIPKLDANDIYSRGRFGGWKYEVSNQDHTFMQGVEWAEMMLSGKKEETYVL